MTRAVWVAFGLWLSLAGTAPCAHAGPVSGASVCAVEGAPSLPRVSERWRHAWNGIALTGRTPRHHGHDVFVPVGAPQWAEARFGYGLPERALEDETVDAYVLRDCNRWERLGTVRTSGHGHDVTRGDGSAVREGGGWAVVPVPITARLGVGMHHVRFVVRGDGSAADLVINVVPCDVHYVVSDIDGTLTDSESGVAWSVVGLRGPPRANPGAADALQALARRGFQVFYLTGRPDWMERDTRRWLLANGFPDGVIRTMEHVGLGLWGRHVAEYKVHEIAELVTQMGRAPAYGFGNTSADVMAYRAAGIEPGHRFFYRFDGDCQGGRRHSDYRALAEVLGAAALAP